MTTVLVVEDVEDNRELVRLLLETAGHRVVEAHNGLDALAMAKAHRPGLVLMDLSLPGIDGFEAFRRLRADEATSAIPVVALTAHAMAGDRERVLAAGFDGYLPKPIEVSAFEGAIAPYLG